MKRHWKTLRFRLALWNALTVILTAAVILIGLRQGVHWALLHELDQILAEDIEEVTLALSELPEIGFEQLAEELDRKATGHRHHEWFVQFVGSDGDIVWSSLNTPPQMIPFSGEATPVPYSVGNYRLVQRDLTPPGTTVAIASPGERSRDTAHRADSTDHSVATIRVGVALTLLKQDMARIDRLVLLLVGLVLALAPLIGYVLAGPAAGWIGSIIHTASRLRPDHLDERLPVRGVGDELDQLATTVNQLLDRIAASLKQKQEFLANSAHELRTPLAAIRSSVEVALVSRRSPDEYEDLLVKIIERGTALERLVNQLLLISETEIEQSKSHEEQVSLHELVRQSAEMLTAVAESRDIDLQTRISDGVRVRGRRHLLRQLANNLIDNALKYTPQGGRVEVSLTRDDVRRVAVLTVSDTGIGIDPVDVPHVFDRFFRAGRQTSRAVSDSSRSHAMEGEKATGTGLGLSICQAVTAAHHGEIVCQSEPGKGTKITVRLPLASESSPKLPASPSGPRSLANTPSTCTRGADPDSTLFSTSCPS